MKTQGLTPQREGLQLPVTVSAMIEPLLLILSDADQSPLAVKPEHELVDYHLNLGPAIRNAWLYALGNRLLQDCGERHPEDESAVIIHALWKKL
ncbi:hypothetical protein GO003_008560 [Methylicorpusculum oleiharenae]|uniref:DUF6794 domain-containing protein n=1 Tax=Methylicorpusculum oleiharenae TaxID=1338687 RepID=UPI00135A9EC0|nr:DUF6794 domain-containing protein [Methylicorpusculum oleiharenae]MCD2450437.1 hypothetical protein [Methylicorpusculum oleiharenae]